VFEDRDADPATIKSRMSAANIQPNRVQWYQQDVNEVMKYIPFLQKAFSTVSPSWRDWLVCVAVASSVLWLRELSKLVLRTTRRIKVIAIR